MSTISQFYSEGKLLEEMKCVFKDEDTIVDFHALLEKARNFTNKSVQDRHTILSDIVFYKGELEAQKKKVAAIIEKQDMIDYGLAFNILVSKGLRYTEELIKVKREELRVTRKKKAEEEGQPNTERKYEMLKEIYACCDKWTQILTDLYFILNSSNKILSTSV